MKLKKAKTTQIYKIHIKTSFDKTIIEAHFIYKSSGILFKYIAGLYHYYDSIIFI